MKRRNEKNKKKEPAETKKRGKKGILIASVAMLIALAVIVCYLAPTEQPVEKAEPAVISTSASAITAVATTAITPAPAATLAIMSTPTPTPISKEPAISGEFVVNDSMPPPPETPVPAPSGNPVILSLEGPETVSAGDTFTVEVRVNPNGRNASGIQANFRFDKNLVQVDSVTMSDAIDKDFLIPATINNEQGVVENIIRMSLSPDSFLQEEFVFAVISLTAKNTGNAKLQLERSVATYASGAENPTLLPTKAEEKTIAIKATG